MNEDIVQPKRMGSLKRSWIITKSAWQIMKLDKEVIAVPLITGLIGIVIATVGFGGGLLLSHSWDYYFHNVNGIFSSSGGGSSMQFSHITYGVWIATSALLAIVSTFTLAAMIAIGLKRLRGGDPVLADGYSAIKKNFWSLVIFSLFSFGIVQIMQYLQSRLPLFGRLLAFLGQLAWAVAAFFAVPVIVDSKEPIGPITATKESMALIKRTWKESGGNQFLIGGIFTILIIFELMVGLFAGAGLWVSVGKGAGVAAGSLSMVLILFTILISSALEGIAKAVLYYYAATGEAPEQFDQRLLKEAFTPKKARRVFGF